MRGLARGYRDELILKNRPPAAVATSSLAIFSFDS